MNCVLVHSSSVSFILLQFLEGPLKKIHNAAVLRVWSPVLIIINGWNGRQAKNYLH